MLSLDFKIINDWFYDYVTVLSIVKYYFICIGKNIDEAEVHNLNDLRAKNGKEI